MKTIKVPKEQLVRQIEENMLTHREEFEKAWDGYRAKYVKNIENILDAAKDSKRGAELVHFINLTAPQDHTEDYERALKMLEWDTEQMVELSQQEFTQYVQDNWGWKEQFRTTNSMYTEQN